MSDQIINVHGEDKVVREDTAKAFRGIHWAIASMIGFVVITAVIAAIFLFGAAAREGKIESPAANTGSTR